MKVADHISSLRRDGELLAAAAERTSPDAPVPTCPEWVVRDLVRHQGGVHRWAAGYVGDRRNEVWDVDLDDVVGSWPDDGELVGWFREGHRHLVATLEAAHPDLDCWTFLRAPSPLAMWARRQAHETAIHRVDAELAADAAAADTGDPGDPAGTAGTTSPFEASFAADGVDELLTCFITRPRGRLRSATVRTLDVVAADTGDRWQVRIGPDRVETRASLAADGGGDDLAPGDCQLEGDAADLYLTLWSRRPVGGLSVAGDRAVLDLFLDQVHVRWS